MKHAIRLVAAVVVVGLAAPAAMAFVDFREVTSDANGDYLWAEPDNWAWYNQEPSLDGYPNDANQGDICMSKGTTSIIQGADIIVRGLHVGKHGPADETATLTVRSSGMLWNGGVDPETVGLAVGEKGDAVLNVEGGTVEFLRKHSQGFKVGVSGYTGSVNVSGDGRLSTGGGFMGSTGTASLSVSGSATWGLLARFSNYGEITVSGSATVEHTGDHYNRSLWLMDGTAGGGGVGVLTVIGGDATVNLGTELAYNNAGTKVAFERTASGNSTINVGGSFSTISGGVLDMTADANATGETGIVLFHSNNSPDIGLLTVTGDPDFQNLRVFDVAGDGGSLGYDVLMDYVGGTVEPLMGDVNLSGLVDDDDLSLLLANWNIGDEWGEGDLNENGTVDDDDLSLLLANWGAGGSAAPEAVPEPATLGLLAIGDLGALLRRRR